MTNLVNGGNIGNMEKGKIKSYGTTEASRLTGVFHQTINKYVREGKIDGFINNLSGRVAVTQKGIEQLKKAFRRK